MRLPRRWFWALATLAACSPGQVAGDWRAGEGDPLPLVEIVPGWAALIWVIDAQACLGCDLDDPARVVRSIQRRGKETFAIRVIALSDQGEADRALVERFLNANRILADVAMHSYRDHARAFGSGPVPGFYMVDPHGVIRGVVAVDGAEEWRSTAESLDVAGFLRLLAEEGKGEGTDVGADR